MKPIIIRKMELKCTSYHRERESPCRICLVDLLLASTGLEWFHYQEVYILLLRSEQNVGGIYLADNQPNMAKHNKEAMTATQRLEKQNKTSRTFSVKGTAQIPVNNATFSSGTPWKYHESVEFSQLCIVIHTSECVYQENTSGKWDIPWYRSTR